jgi:hypothetical protein
MFESKDDKIHGQQAEGPTGPSAGEAPGDQIRTGDTVMIRPMEEIEKTLDHHMRTAGVDFMAGMARFCGQKAAVMKPVTYIWDEKAWRLLKCKDLFILKGLVCDGRDLYQKEGCQRRCHYFWKSAWLKKIVPGVQGNTAREEAVSEPSDDGAGCQLKGVYEAINTIFEDLNLFDRLWLMILRLRSALRRRILKFKRLLPVKVPGPTVVNRSGTRSVRILPYAEIEKRLSPDGRTDSLQFVPAMRPFCGTTRHGVKRVKYFLDERDWKWRKLRNVVLFDDTICSGQGIFRGKDCDRGCFFYWHESWLAKEGTARTDG